MAILVLSISHVTAHRCRQQRQFLDAAERSQDQTPRQDTKLKNTCCVESLHGLFMDDGQDQVTREETGSKKQI